jgi:hypothetical protein
MRELQNLELQAVNGGGASNLVIGVSIASLCLISLVAMSVMSRKNTTVVVLEEHDAAGTGPNNNTVTGQ